MAYEYDLDTISPAPTRLTKQQVADYWRDKGATAEASRGIANALYKESGVRGTDFLDPMALNEASGAIGLGQHLGSRKTRLQALPDWHNPYSQLDFMYSEVTGGDPEASRFWNNIKSSDTSGADKLWTQHFERSEAKPGAPRVNFAQSGIAFEQGRSDTDVANIDPLEFLALLPPIEDDATSKAKGDSLRKSLLAGDDIEAIPSLEVKPFRNNLKIVDYDGRHRAQAAVDAGLDTMPVAIRGVPQLGDKEFKNLVGEKSIPYSSLEKIAREPGEAPASTPVPPPAIGAPSVTAPTTIPPAPAPVPKFSPPTPSPAPTTPAAKPDFYPQIVAGINRGIVSPRSEAYRGVGVPNPAANVTAGDRIANANALSAGQIGLPPAAPPPSNALSSLLSQFNPISSAAAAEAPSASQTPNTYDLSTVSPANVGAGDYDIESIAPAPPRPSYIPVVSDVGPPVINALTALPRNIAADVAAIGQGNIPWRDINAFNQARENALKANRTLPVLPETPAGRALSAIAAVPAQLFGWAAEHVIGDVADVVRGKPFGTSYNEGAVSPYMPLASDVFGAATLNPRVANALSRPVAPVLRQPLKTPEMAAGGAINKVADRTFRAGGAQPAEIQHRLDTAKQSGIPVAPIDFIIPGEPISKLFVYSLEHSPEARAAVRKFDEERTEGVRPTPAAEPKGGFLDRMTKHVEDFFGTGSAFNIRNGLYNSIRGTQKTLAKATVSRDKMARNLTAAVNKAANDALVTGASFDPVRVAPGLRAELQKKDIEIERLQDKLDNDSASLDGLNLGTQIYSSAKRVEHIRSFLSRNRNRPDAIKNFRIGVSDAIRDQLRRARLGQEVSKVDTIENMHNKFTDALDSSTRANDFWRRIENEAQIAEGSAHIRRALGGESRAAERNAGQMRRALEAAAHIGGGAVVGTHIYSPLYWGIRGGRQLLDTLLSGGGVTARTQGKAIVDKLIDPDTVIDTGPKGRGFVEVPPLPPSRANALASLRRWLPAATYGAGQSYTPEAGLQ